MCITKTRNGKLVALERKQPLQEKLDIFSVLLNSVRSGEKGVFTRPNAAIYLIALCCYIFNSFMLLFI